MSLASSIQALQRQVVEDLSTAGDLLGTALRSGTLPSRADVPPSVITTSAYTLAIATLSVLMLNSRSRKLIWDVIETLLATALLLVLLVVVLGLPFGECQMRPGRRSLVRRRA